jgi:hypothetical protein
MRQFLRQAFCDGGVPSASRLLTIPQSLAAIFVLVYATVKNHAVPDGAICTGLGAFATAHYAINKVAGIWQNKGQADPSLDPKE